MNYCVVPEKKHCKHYQREYECVEIVEQKPFQSATLIVNVQYSLQMRGFLSQCFPTVMVVVAFLNCKQSNVPIQPISIRVLNI
jgi:hypothetical protein